MKLEFSQHIFEKYPTIKFHETPSSGSWVATSGQTDMLQVIITYRNFANAPKKESIMWGPRPSVPLYATLDRSGEDKILCTTGGSITEPSSPVATHLPLQVCRQ